LLIIIPLGPPCSSTTAVGALPAGASAVPSVVGDILGAIAVPLYAERDALVDTTLGASSIVAVHTVPALVESKEWLLRGTVKIDRRGSNDLTEVVKKEVERITDNKRLHNRLIPQRVHNTDDVKWEFKCAMARRCGCEVRTRGVLSGDILAVYSWQVHNDHVQPMNKESFSPKRLWTKCHRF
jgi:hypothetical protein